MEKKTEEKDRY